MIHHLMETLKLRRVQWFAHHHNIPSTSAAKRLGFKHEGLLHWDRVLGVDKAEGIPLPEMHVASEAAAGRGLGRHSALLAIGWEDWESGTKRQLEELMSRPVQKRDASTLVR